MADPTFEVGICHAFFMISWKTLSDSDLLTDLKCSVTSHAVETTQFTYGRMIVDCNSPKSVARLDCVPAHCLSFGILLLVVLLVLELILEVLLIVAVDVEVFLLQHEQSMTEISPSWQALTKVSMLVCIRAAS